MKITETDLGKRVIEWLEKERPEWRVYQELSSFGYNSRVADIVCIKGDFVWVIELKTSLSLTVIRQAFEWDVDYRSIAVPDTVSGLRNENREWWYSYLGRSMDIGTIIAGKSRVYTRYCGDYGRDWPRHKVKFDVDEATPSGRYLSTKQRFIALAESGLAEGQWLVEAGSKSGNHWTPYKQSMLEIREYITNNPGCTMNNIFDALGKLHYANKSSAKGCIPGRLQSIETWCRVDTSTRPYRFYIEDEHSV